MRIGNIRKFDRRRATRFRTFLSALSACLLALPPFSLSASAQNTQSYVVAGANPDGQAMGIILIIGVIIVGVSYYFNKRDVRHWQKVLRSERLPTIIRTYRGSQSSSNGKFQTEAREMAAYNYFPSSQIWMPGQWSAGSFIVALLLCFVVIGIVVFIYMLIVKPGGSLTVTYELKAAKPAEKTCPQCAETIKAEAAICRFCGHQFARLKIPDFSIEKKQ